MGPAIVKAVKRVTSLPIDVHLMIENPEFFIQDFVDAGATMISAHVETCTHLNRTIQMIKEVGLSPGIVLNPSTPLSSIDWALEYVDFVLIMSVNPGFGGQKFISNSLSKIKVLRRIIEDRGLSTLIQIDGGVKEENIKEISLAGADAFVAGSAIFGSKNYKETIQKLKENMGG